ncbi:FAD-linked oxidase [Prauserella marina]|uniref:FAD/FMN-containing dehydrogenase n=1 Tax=Prauserella marina TaxID=530584 RepID=A0A222VZU2_9PSEU|nr:FAD-binding oxidoreductase [Prauserella marina]ASR39302.1 FAD-linked oxidase [Prauserella marina]PWV76820.1 FAD/FMN-containing dehydrogenase [Prauserella marina]SDC98315.1 FAD/FMN-containing dehydrogenase [Prauserella marina]
MTIDHSARHVGEATLGEFAAALRGTVVRDGDETYERERAVWNAAHDRRPALIAKCAGVADVTRTVELAHSEGLPLAVRGGGHSIPGFSTCDDGIVLDLAAMKGVRVDVGSRTVSAEAGCLWRDVDAETQNFGLAVTGGLVSTTGIAGFTLGGGIGWLVRRYGLTMDNLIGADVVTADGGYLRADDDHNPDLFWALRGGGGNFGVVTSFDYRLHDIGRTVYSGLVFYPAEEAESVLRGYPLACAQAPDNLTTLVNMTTAPPLPFLPESVHGKPVVAIAGCWVGEGSHGDEATQPFRSLGTVIADVFAPHPYTAWQQALDPLYPRGLHNYFRSSFLRTADKSALDTLHTGFAEIPNGLCEIHLHHLGGAMAKTPPEATAFAVRDHDYIVNVIARTATASGYREAVDWAKGVTSMLGPDAATYVNFTGEGSADRARAAYPGGTYRRLVEVKDRYDPTNLFSLNQNIQPSR